MTRPLEVWALFRLVFVLTSSRLISSAEASIIEPNTARRTHGGGTYRTATGTSYNETLGVGAPPRANSLPARGPAHAAPNYKRPAAQISANVEIRGPRKKASGPTCQSVQAKSYTSDCSAFMQPVALKSAKPRVAVLVTGFVRSWSVVRGNFLTNVIEANPPGTVHSVFCVAVQTPPSRCESDSFAEMKSIPGATAITYDAAGTVIFGSEDRVKVSCSARKVKCGQYWAITQAFKLLGHHPEERYDMVMRARTDFSFKRPVVFALFLSSFGATPWAAESGGNFMLVPCGGGSDMIALGTTATMEKYGTMGPCDGAFDELPWKFSFFYRMMVPVSPANTNTTYVDENFNFVYGMSENGNNFKDCRKPSKAYGVLGREKVEKNNGLVGKSRFTDKPLCAPIFRTAKLGQIIRSPTKQDHPWAKQPQNCPDPPKSKPLRQTTTAKRRG